MITRMARGQRLHELTCYIAHYSLDTTHPHDCVELGQHANMNVHAREYSASSMQT